MQNDTQTFTDLVVVDTNTDEYQPLLKAAEKLNLAPQVFNLGDDAIRHAGSVASGLWVIGTRLVDMSGLELLAWLRERDPATTVYLVSETYLPQEEIAARMSGASAYFCRPPQADWLRGVRGGSAKESAKRRAFTQPAAHG